MKSINQTEILSMDVTPDDSSQHDYRIRFGDQVKYITIEPRTFDYETLSFPPALLEQLPEFPNDNWVSARISRSKEPESDGFCIDLSYKPLKGVSPQDLWHPTRIDVLSLEEIDRYGAGCRIVRYGSSTAVAKIARFEFEIPSIAAETSIYEILQGHDIGPQFYGHLTEHGRVMGILIENLQGRRAAPSDIRECEKSVRKLHALGLCHGDLNRHNFIVSDSGVKLIDFESVMKATPSEMEEELKELERALADESGLGGEVGMSSDEEI